MKRRNFLYLAGAAAAGSPLPSAAAAPELRDLDSLLEPIRKKHDLPALAGALVTTKGATALGAVGVRKYGDPTPVTHSDRFHIGSCTKSMTATLIGMLVDQGKLTWEMPLTEAFPAVGVDIHPKLRAVTLNHLLCQRSGITGENWLPGKTFQDMHDLPGPPRKQREAYVAAILREAPEAEPGSKFIYSNRNFTLAGALAERVTNTAWEDLMVERLFKPLRMSSAGFGAMGTPGRIDQPWQHVKKGNIRVAIEPGPRADNPPVIGPAGTVHCALGDWAEYAAAHLKADRGALMHPETLTHLHTPLFGGEYAFGWIATQRPWGGGTVLTHSGSNNQNFAVVWLAPLKGFAVLAATNQGGEAADKACDEVASALIAEHLKNA